VTDAPAEGEAAPSLVVLYALATGRPVAVAAFRHDAAAGVTVEVRDEEWGAVARRYADHGVRSLCRGRVIQPHEGAAFMRALVEPRLLSYYAFVDESDGPSTVDPVAT
jgi:hypothetical protein